MLYKSGYFLGYALARSLVYVEKNIDPIMLGYILGLINAALFWL